MKQQTVSGAYPDILTAFMTAIRLGCVAFIRRAKDGIEHELHLIGVIRP